MAVSDGPIGTVGSSADGVTPALSDAFGDLAQRGWHVLTGLRQPGQAGACIDAVLVGPGGVLVVESTATRRRASGLSGVVAAVVSLVPGESRRHVQAVVCPPAESPDSGAVNVKPSVLAGFVRSLPQVLSVDGAARVAATLRDALGGPLAPLWTVNKVLEWTKDARGSETPPRDESRRGRRRRSPRPSRVGAVVSSAGWALAAAAVLAVLLTLLSLLGG